MRAEIVRRHLQRFFPARDPIGQRPVDVLESLFGGCVAGLSNPVENAPRHGLLLGFVAQERVFERHVLVARIQAHGFRELVARVFVFADLQQRVGQIFMNGRAIRREGDGLPESGDGLIVVFLAKRCVGLLQRPISRVGILGDPGSLRQRQDKDYS